MLESVGDIGHIIEVSNTQKKLEITEMHIGLIRDAVAATLDYEQIAYICEINVEIVDNEAVQAINFEFRGKNIPTDVLSFPMIEAEKLPYLRKSSDSSLSDYTFEEDINPETGAVLLGDIAISAEKAREQSVEFNQSFERELAFLIVHSVLHLLGYDHELSEEADADMRKRQREIMDLLQSWQKSVDVF